MKTLISDFEGQYKAYEVHTDNGGAFKRPHYGRAVDIGADRSIVLTTEEAQALYGDACALRLVNPDNWPGNVRLFAAEIKLITLSATFNEIMKMGAKLAASHGGQKLSGLNDDLKGGIAAAFAQCAAQDNLVPLGQYFVTSRAMLESFTAGEVPETERGMGDGIMECPNEIAATYTGAGAILPDMQPMLCFNEIDFPGYAVNNRYYISGLYRGDFKDVELPVARQSQPSFAMSVAELRRTLG